MQFRVLGAIEIQADGRVIGIGPPQRRTVLAALAVDAGEPVSLETLVDRVWDENPPSAARTALYAHITRIRGLLAEMAVTDTMSTPLRRHGGGYLLDVDRDQVDLHRVQRLAERAQAEQSTDAERVTLLREALAMWRGVPLANVPGEWAARVRHGVEQKLLGAAVLWAQAELALGQPDTVIGKLSELVARYPLAEPLVAVLMRALCAARRSAEALECYASTHRHLIERLGAGAGPELRELHAAILRGDFDQQRPAPRPALYDVPAQLPVDVRGFTGRTSELNQLDALLHTTTVHPAPMVIATITGTAGVGKTALAVHWAHRVASHFPDGQLYVNLRGFAPDGAAMSPADAVRGFLDAFAVPPQRIPAGLDAQAALYRSILAGRRVLVVLDNARDTKQVRPLLPGAPGSLVLVTSRDQLAGLVVGESAYPLTLNLLSAAEARQLLVHRLGAPRVTAEPDAVDEIIKRCARLALALSIVAARAARHLRFPLAVLAAELRTARGGLDAFADHDPDMDVRAVLSWSYRTLSPDAARLFRLLGLHPGPDITVPAAASLAGTTAAQARLSLAKLTRANVVAEHNPGRFAFHDLLAGYATELAHVLDSRQERQAATHRILDHYLYTAHAADRLLDPHRDRLVLATPHPGTHPEELADSGQALDWFKAEHPALLRAIDMAIEARLDTYTWQFAWVVGGFFDRHGHWRDLATIQHAALEAVGRLGDRTRHAEAHRGLGRAYARLGRFDDAHLHLQQALRRYRELGDDTGQAHTHRNLSWLLERQARYEEALIHSLRALRLSQSAGQRHGQAKALNHIGWNYALLGKYHQALAHCQRALTLSQEIGDRYAEANTWDSLGYAHHHLGHHADAILCYRNALDLIRQVGDRHYEAETLTHLGDTHRAADDIGAARAAWQDALVILDDLDYPDTRRLHAKLNEL